MPSFSFEVEYAKSNRAACKKCKDKIAKDHVRVGIKQEQPEDAEGAAAHFGCSWYHFACFHQAKGQKWFKTHFPAEVDENVAGLASLKDDDREAVLALFKACRGEGPVPAAPIGPESEAPVKVASKRKVKEGDADDAGAAKAQKVAFLTEAQEAAIVEAKANLASKNASYLGAILAKNGLPKTGRKEELIDRAAENQVLGVPPTCDVCQKKKLSWSRGTGKFSCPGFFDDESKSFRKCKGPAGTDLQRTPFEDLGA